MQISQTLRRCINFHKVVQELYEQGEINFKEKNKLKTEFNTNNEDILYLIEDMEKENFKQQIIEYVKSKHQIKLPNSPGLRRKSLLPESSPTIGRKSAFFKESKITEEELIVYITKLREALVEVYQSRSSALTYLVQDHLKSLTQLINRLSSKSPQASLILLQEQNIGEEIEYYYKQLKNQFLNTHSLLIIEININNTITIIQFLLLQNLFRTYQIVMNSLLLIHNMEYMIQLKILLILLNLMIICKIQYL